MSQNYGPDMALGLNGFSFADLHRPSRLRDLYARFVEQVKSTEPELWSQWQQYQEVPESFTNIGRSNLIVAMAPHVSRFVSALFGVGDAADALMAQTRAYDVLFRFKIDFVRRRAFFAQASIAGRKISGVALGAPAAICDAALVWRGPLGP